MPDPRTVTGKVTADASIPQICIEALPGIVLGAEATVSNMTGKQLFCRALTDLKGTVASPDPPTDIHVSLVMLNSMKEAIRVRTRET